MTETTESGRSSPNSHRLRGWSRFKLNFTSIALILGGAIVGFGIGWKWNYLVVQTGIARAMQFKADNDKLKEEIADKNAAIAALQAKFAHVQGVMESMAPSENTYGINANQSVIVAGGHLTVGLIGAPTYERVNVNINGKQQSMAVGDVVNVAPDASTVCQVGVQSFDMFKAFLTASCSGAKPR